MPTTTSSKPFDAPELLARVRALLRRGREPAELLAHGDLAFDVGTRTTRRGGRDISLSATEADLLEVLLRNQRRVVTREAALAQVWGAAHAATPNLVDRYVSYLRRKLGDPPLIETVRGARLRHRTLIGELAPRRSVVAAVLGIAVAVAVAGAGVSVLASRDLHRTLDRSLRQRAATISQLSASAPALLDPARCARHERSAASS